MANYLRSLIAKLIVTFVYLKGGYPDVSRGSDPSQGVADVSIPSSVALEVSHTSVVTNAF